MTEIEEYIYYAGERVKFVREIDNIDEAQAMIDYYRGRGKKACCLHYNDSHQLYVSE